MNNSSLEARVGRMEKQHRWLMTTVKQILQRLAGKSPVKPAAAGQAAQQKAPNPTVLHWSIDPEHEKALRQVQRDFDRMGEGEHTGTIYTSDGREVSVRTRRGRAEWIG